MIARMVPSRGLASLHTLTGRSDKRVPAYKAYLRVSFLELERVRHGQEIRTTRARLERMLDRCQQIESEKAAILAAAGQPVIQRLRHQQPCEPCAMAVAGSPSAIEASTIPSTLAAWSRRPFKERNHGSQQDRDDRSPGAKGPVSRRHPTSHATTRLAAVSDAVRSFLISELQAREVRVTRIAASAESGGGWETEAEILVPDLAIMTLGLTLTQEVLEQRRYVVQLDQSHTVIGYEPLDHDG